MSNPYITSVSGSTKSTRKFSALARIFTYFAGALLPVLGLIVFFELTRPAIALHDGSLSKRFSSMFWQTALYTKTEDNICSAAAVSQIPGVSALLSRAKHVRTAMTAKEAGRAFREENTDHWHVGYETLRVSADGRRFLFRVTRKEPFSDQPMPDAGLTLGVAQVSTERYFEYVSGSWRYGIEIEDHGTPSYVAVQKSL